MGAGGDHTRTAAALGTPAYRSPEQVRGGAARVGRPADVWAPGVVLDGAVAGVRPSDADDAPAVTKRVTCAEPARRAGRRPPPLAPADR